MNLSDGRKSASMPRAVQPPKRREDAPCRCRKIAPPPVQSGRSGRRGGAPSRGGIIAHGHAGRAQGPGAQVCGGGALTFPRRREFARRQLGPAVGHSLSARISQADCRRFRRWPFCRSRNSQRLRSATCSLQIECLSGRKRKAFGHSRVCGITGTSGSGGSECPAVPCAASGRTGKATPINPRE